MKSYTAILDSDGGEPKMSQKYADYANILNEGSNIANQISIESSYQTSQYVNQSALPFQICTETESATQKTQRSCNFTIEDDNLLVSAWLNISFDAVQENEQNREPYWEKIFEYYNKDKNFTSDLSSNFLKNRWLTIELSVNKFCGCYAQIEAINQSGVNEQDKICQAKQMYQSIQKYPFLFLHCWNELRHEPKWLEFSQKKKSRKAKNTSHSSSSLSTPDSINFEEDYDASDTFVNFERPLLRKAAKKMPKKKKNKKLVHDNTSKSVATILKEFTEGKKEMDQKKLELFERTYAQQEERLLLKKEKIRMERLKEEERIMLIDTSCMIPQLVEYYKSRQMQIMEKKD